MAAIPLTHSVLSSFQVTKSYVSSGISAFSTCFDDPGDYCAVSTKLDRLHVYSCRDGTQMATVNNYKYGVGNIRFTHLSSNLIQSSTKGNDDIRYFSLHDNQFIRFFKGHTKRVISLEMSPLDDQFISSSADGTARLWDLRSPQCHGLLEIGNRSAAAIDNAGLVFAVAKFPEIRLYDIRSYDTGPFSTWTVRDDQIPTKAVHYWTSIKFTNDGQHILLTTSSNIHYLIHAFEGKIVKRLLGPEGVATGKCNRMKHGEDTTLTPDGRYAIASTFEGCLSIWDLHTQYPPRPEIARAYDPQVIHSALPNAYPIVDLVKNEPIQGVSETITAISFHPNSAMLVTAGEDTINFWEPTQLAI